MKVLSILSAVVVSLGFVISAPAAEKKAAAKKEGAAPAAEAKKATAKPAAEGKKPAKAVTGKPITMYARVDSIDTAGKSFIHKTKEGEMKHVLAATAEIKNAKADAKFEDIKVGDMVSGSRIRKSATEYEVTKITKFGAAAPKAPKAAKKAPAKEGEAKPAAKEGEKKPAAKKE